MLNYTVPFKLQNQTNLKIMKKYEKYKDSGIEWIGEIPEHWGVKRLKHLVESSLKYGANESADEEVLEHPRYIRITDFGNDGKLRDDTFKSLPPKVAEPFLLIEGDLLFARSGATVGKTFQFKNYKGKACFAGYLIRANFNNNLTSSDYINYFTKSNFYENWKQSIFQQATIQNIGADKYNQLIISLPLTINEQTAISTYLDHKTAQIDNLISKKEKLIELLKEERVATINQAVTSGLDEKGNLRQKPQCLPAEGWKDSGIEWLGEIPVGWEISIFKRITLKIKDGTHGTFNRVSSGYTLLSAKNVFNEGLNITNNESLISEKDFIEITRNGFPAKGDLLITCVGTIGRTTVYEDSEPKAFQRSVSFLRLNSDKASPYFYKVFVQSDLYQNLLNSIAKTSAQSGVYMNDIMNSTVVIPPINEQHEIVCFLNDKIEKYDKRIKKNQKQITLLKEYKTALISEVVTGKVDVRNEQINNIQ